MNRKLIIAALLALVGLQLGACSTRVVIPMDLPEYRHHAPAATVQAVDVLALTPGMKAFARHYAEPGNNHFAQIHELNLAVNSDAILGFDYTDSLTLSASEAFDRRAGNCIAYSNLMVALFREVGLKATYQLIQPEPLWYSANQTVMVAKHVNVLVHGPGETWVIDNSGMETRNAAWHSTISDEEAEALYYNNLGIEALIEGDLSRAWAWLDLAIATAPGLSDNWVNLGVIYARNGQPRAAEAIYRHALEIDPDQISALANLYQLYFDNGETAKAEKLAGRVERYRRNNPFYLMHLAQTAIEEERLDKARELSAQAIEIKNDEHLFWFVQARALYLSGNVEEAQASFEQARDLAPNDLLVDYSQPISALAFEN